MRIPPEYTTSVDYRTEGPTMVTAHPCVNKVELNVSAFLPPVHVPTVLLATVKLPMELVHPMMELREKFMRILRVNVPLNAYDRYPSFPMFNMSTKILLWNVQGVGKKSFSTTLKEIIRINNPSVLGLMETHISGDTAQKVCDHIGFSGQTRVEAQELSGGIWLVWKQEELSVNPIQSHGQHMTVEIAK